MKPTAIEWFLANLPIRIQNAMKNECDSEIEQAKKMEMNHILNSYNDGYRDGMSDQSTDTKDISEFSNAKLYFDETFSKSKLI